MRVSTRIVSPSSTKIGTWTTSPVSVVAGLRERIGDLLQRLTGFVPEEMLEGAEYIRQYTGPPLAENFKSVSFRITVGSAERTLSSEEVGAVRNGMIEGMRGLGYELRV